MNNLNQDSSYRGFAGDTADEHDTLVNFEVGNALERINEETPSPTETYLAPIDLRALLKQSATVERHFDGRGRFLPWGMQWGDHGKIIPIQSCVLELAEEAKANKLKFIDEYRSDPDVRNTIKQYADALREYIYAKRAINSMSATRRLRNEIADTARCWCQAMKYHKDFEEKYTYFHRNGRDPTQKETQLLNNLKAWAKENLYEGYLLSQALIIAIDCIDPEDKLLTKGLIDWPILEQAKRVMEYSCSKMQRYYSQPSLEQENRAAERQADKLDAQQAFWK